MSNVGKIRAAGCPCARVLMIAIVLITAGAMFVGRPAAASAAKAPPSQTVVAGRLARQLTTARTANQRYNALLSMMKALHIGVYKGNGNPIARGAERSAKDFYVYDFTLRYLAAAVANKQTVSLNTVDTELKLALAPMKPRRAITASLLRGALQRTLKWAQKNPRSGQALPLLLMRELGRKSVKQDLAKPPAESKMKLDSIQAFIVDADFAAALVTARRTGARHATTMTRSTAQVANLCDKFKPIYDLYQNGKLAKEVVTAKDWVNAAKSKIGGEILKGFTVDLISYGAFSDLIRLSVADPLNENDTTHYGPKKHKGEFGTSAGKPLSYGIHVSMPTVPEMIAKCGYLSGIDVKFPKQNRSTGVLSGAPVQWDDLSDAKLAYCSGSGGQLMPAQKLPIDEHGQRYQYPATNGKGDAFFELVPNNELLMGVGPSCWTKGELRASVKVAEIVGLPGSSLLNKVPQKFIDFTYRIGYHRASGYEVARTGPFVWVNPPNDWDDLYVLGHVCGMNPYGRPWLFTGDFTAPAFSATLYKAVAFDGVGKTSTFETATLNGVGWAIQGRILDADASQPARMHFENMPASSLPPGRARTSPSSGYDVTITEDTKDCTADGSDLSLKPPTANFSSSESTSTPQTLSFYDTSNAPYGVNSRAWSFGDAASGSANSSTSAAPSHTFSALGTYTITLQITDGMGQTAVVRQQVTVKAAPTLEAKFTAYQRSPHTWLFSDDSSNASPGATRAWNFGDPASGAANASTEGAPEHTFSATGTYTVTLTVTDAGRTSSTSQQVVAPADQPPTADFTWEDIGSNQAEFSDDSADPDGGWITSYAWDFGDGGTSIEASPTHTYAAPGQYAVKLTVTDDAGLTAEKTETITVS